VYLGGMAILKLLLILALIILGIKRKLFVGYVLLAAGVVTPLLFGFGIQDVGVGVWGTFSSIEFWRLFVALVIITFLGHLLKEIGSLDRLTEAAQELAGGKKTATAVLPAAVGLMPMPGGALLSAPLVGEVLKADDKSPRFLSAANYWFRHVMEFFWPLYPGIIIGAGITGISIQTFSLLGIIMSLAMILIGWLFFLRRINNHQQSTHNLHALGRICISIWPLFLTVFLALVVELDIVIALLIAVAVMVATNRSSWPNIWPVFKSSATLRLFFMVFGILVFKDMLELSGAVGNIPDEVARLGIPPAMVIFTVGFLTGLLSGMVAAIVGLSFPILSGFLYSPEINLSNIFLAYLCGYFGMMLSPTHFCLLLTTEHFKAELTSVYRTFIVPLIILVGIGIILYSTGYPWNIIQP
jgi:integral membrane protein (TIGR00529 family)